MLCCAHEPFTVWALWNNRNSSWIEKKQTKFIIENSIREQQWNDYSSAIIFIYNWNMFLMFIVIRFIFEIKGKRTKAFYFISLLLCLYGEHFSTTKQNLQAYSQYYWMQANNLFYFNIMLLCFYCFWLLLLFHIALFLLFIVFTSLSLSYVCAYYLFLIFETKSKRQF